MSGSWRKQKTKYHKSKQKNIGQENNSQDIKFNLDWQSCWKKNAASMRTSRGRSCTAKLITTGIWNNFLYKYISLNQQFQKKKSFITDFISVILFFLGRGSSKLKIGGILASRHQSLALQFDKERFYQPFYDPHSHPESATKDQDISINTLTSYICK